MVFLISESFTELYGDNPEEVRFNANSARKFWEKRVTELQLHENEKQAHLAQAAHWNDQEIQEAYFQEQKAAKFSTQRIALNEKHSIESNEHHINCFQVLGSFQVPRHSCRNYLFCQSVN